jgi:hypothetical protein
MPQLRGVSGCGEYLARMLAEAAKEDRGGFPGPRILHGLVRLGISIEESK